MCKLTKITLEYAATRSQSYQSVRVGRAVEIELSEGEDRNKCIAKINDWLVKEVNQDADAAMIDLLTGDGQAAQKGGN